MKSYWPALATFAAFAVLLSIGGVMDRGTPPVTATATNQFERAQRQTLLVETPNGTGSAVIVRQGPHWRALTAAHVVESFTNVTVRVTIRVGHRQAGHTVFDARVLRRDATNDLALLEIVAPDSAFSVAPIAAVAARVGDSIFHVGNFLGRYDSSVTQGIVSQVGVTHPPWAGELDQSSAPAYPGSSGGPVFNSRGEVAGILVGGMDSTFTFFVPLRVINVFLKEGL